MSNTPSDAEIDNLLCKHWPAYSMQAVLVKMWLREAVESAIAQWGTPQPVVREPLTREQALKIVKVTPDAMCAIRMTEAAHGITQKGGQHVGSVG